MACTLLSLSYDPGLIKLLYGVQASIGVWSGIVASSVAMSSDGGESANFQMARTS
jgi:hypothetical protein